MKKNSLINGLLGTLTVFSFDDKSVSGAEKNEESADGLTSVSRYISKIPMPTGVDKYLKSHNKGHATGVAKYMAKQLLSGKEKMPSTGVAKYLVKQSRSERGRPAVSGVAKYVARNNIRVKLNTPIPTGVASYIAKCKQAKQECMPTTGVDRYEYERSLAAKKAEAAKLVKKYIKKQAALAAREAEKKQKQVQEAVIENEAYDPAATGVSVYLDKLEKQEKVFATGVAKYVTKKALILASAAPKTGVAKYIARQATVSKETPTGVAAYIRKQVLTTRIIKPVTGVSKYIDRKKQDGSVKPTRSRVEKYLAKHAILDKSANVAAKRNNKAEDQHVAHPEIEAEKQTGVERYLAEKISEVNVMQASLTGVERYLSNKQ